MRFRSQDPHRVSNGLVHSIVTAATPIDDTHSQIVQFCFRNDSEADTSTEDVIRFDNAIVEEDKYILEGTDPDVPLDSADSKRAMTSDKPGLILRKMLRELPGTTRGGGGDALSARRRRRSIVEQQRVLT